MLELTLNKKNKVNLSDYDFEKDIENRTLMADLSFFEYEVLQEIFFSPTKFSLKKLAGILEVDQATLFPFLEKLKGTGLLSIDGDLILINKEMRKQFEFHMRRFDPDFKCDMEYLKGILRKVLIHILPTWYSIPRSSNNIFESIVERHLLTPYLFNSYLADLSFSNPITEKIIQEVFSAKDFRVSSTDIITKYNLTRFQFEEILLTLEFSFVCATTYTRSDDLFLEWITPFHEWREYLSFIKNSMVPPISADKEISSPFSGEFSYVKLFSEALRKIGENTPSPHFTEKFLLLNLIEKTDGNEHIILETGKSFLDLSTEKQALYLYRHPGNKVLLPSYPKELATEKNIREVERSLKNILTTGWVFFDEFVKGALVSFNELHSVVLQKMGTNWQYQLPSHSERELTFIRLTIFEWLFEAGIVDKGVCEGRDCFRVTPFGSVLFEE